MHSPRKLFRKAHSVVEMAQFRILPLDRVELFGSVFPQGFQHAEPGCFRLFPILQRLFREKRVFAQQD